MVTLCEPSSWVTVPSQQTSFQLPIIQEYYKNYQIIINQIIILQEQDMLNITLNITVLILHFLLFLVLRRFYCEVISNDGTLCRDKLYSDEYIYFIKVV